MLPKQESRIEAGYLCSPVLLSAQPVSSYPISGILSPGAAVILGSHGGAPVPYQDLSLYYRFYFPKTEHLTKLGVLDYQSTRFGNVFVDQS